MNPLLENIADIASEDIKRLIKEANDDLLSAIHKMQDEAQLQETAPKFKIAFGISLDFDNHQFDCALSWSVKQSLTTSHAIEDPAQGKLPIEKDDSTVTISTPGTKPVTMTAKQFSRAAKVLSKKK